MGASLSLAFLLSNEVAMAVTHTSAPKIYYEGYDISADHTNIELNMGRQELDKSAFGDVGVARCAGLWTFDFTHEGWVQHNTATPAIEDILHGDIGSDSKIITICPTTGAVNTIAYSAYGVSLSYTPTYRHGELAGFVGAGYSQSEKVVRGTTLLTGAKTESENGTPYELGAVGATEFLYGILHCTAVSGTDTPTITVVIESDDAEAFTDATTRISFTAKTAIGAQWATRVAGAITDTWWRAVCTVTGTNPSLTIHCVMAIKGD